MLYFTVCQGQSCLVRVVLVVGKLCWGLYMDWPASVSHLLCGLFALDHLKPVLLWWCCSQEWQLCSCSLVLSSLVLQCKTLLQAQLLHDAGHSTAVIVLIIVEWADVMMQSPTNATSAGHTDQQEQNILSCQVCSHTLSNAQQKLSLLHLVHVVLPSINKVSILRHNMAC